MVVLRFLTNSFLVPFCGAKTFGLRFELGRRALGLEGEVEGSTAAAAELKLYIFSIEAGRVGNECSSSEVLSFAIGLNLRRLPPDGDSDR